MTQGNSGAQNKLGELFVDFGTKGVGGLLRNLNSVSASFLLGKNAANQFAHTITQPIKQTGQYAMELRNLRNQMSLTNKEAQKIQNWARKFNYSESSVFGDISKLLDDLTQIKNYNIIPKGWYEASRLLAQNGGTAIAQKRYNNTPEGVFELLKDISLGLNKVTDPGARRLIQQSLGVSPEVLNYKDNINSLMSSWNTLTDEQVEAAEESAKALNELGNSLEKLWQRLNIKTAPAFISGSNALTYLLTPNRNKNEKLEKTALGLMAAGGIGGGATAGGAIGSFLGPVGAGIGAIIGAGLGAVLGTAPAKRFLKHAPFELLPELDALGDSDLLHSNGGGNTTVYKEINVNQNITAPDPITAGNKAAQGINELETAEQNMYSGR